MDFNYLIYTDMNTAQIRENQVANSCNFSDSVTTQYADILLHPTQQLWALIVHPNYLKYFTQYELGIAAPLTSDWFPQSSS